MSTDEVICGEHLHYGVELRLTAFECDMIAKALKETKLSVGENSAWDKLRKEFEVLANLTTIKSLRRFGTFDESRLNFK